MYRGLNHIVAMLLLLAVTNSFPQAQAEGVVPLRIRGRVMACTPEQCPEALKILSQVDVPTTPAEPIIFVDEGLATHFGHFRTIYAGYRFPDNRFVGKFVLTAADGSTINGSNSGFFPTPGSPSPFTADFEGGTKRFQYAKAHVEGQLFWVALGVADYKGQTGWIDLDTRR